MGAALCRIPNALLLINTFTQLKNPDIRIEPGLFIRLNMV